MEQNGLRYPVVQDNDYGTWEAWGNQYWPAKYLIDARGKVRYTHFGEGAYDETEEAIRALLAERGSGALGARTRARSETGGAPAWQRPRPTWATSAPRASCRRRRCRARGATPGAGGVAAAQRLRARRHVAGGGRVSDGGERRSAATRASGPRRSSWCSARAQDRPRKLQVELDGRPYREVTVREQRLYTLVSLPRGAGPDAHPARSRPV